MRSDVLNPMRASRRAPWALLVGACGLTLASLGCAAGGAPACHVGADCASGVCTSMGTCYTPDSAVMDGSMPELDAGSDGEVASDASVVDSSVPDSGACVANHDFRVERAELPLAAGLHATFRVATGVDVNTAGTTMADGSRVWDFSGPMTGDHDVLVTTEPLAGAWYEGDFPTGLYASKLSDSADLLGVFSLGPTAQRLLGVVSPADGTTRTKLTYDPPVDVLQLPLMRGGHYSTTATVSGTASGIPGFYAESYVDDVDAHGTLRTPFGDFDVLRVKVVLTQTVGVLVTVRRTFLFVSECFGVVAAVVSQDNELATEFTHAAELRRLK